MTEGTELRHERPEGLSGAQAQRSNVRQTVLI